MHYCDLIDVFASFEGVSSAAYIHKSASLTYHEIYQSACALAAEMMRTQSVRRPVIIWGYKDAGYITAYWACLLCGRALIPVEADTPAQRLQDLIAKTSASLILSTTPVCLSCRYCDIAVIDVNQPLEAAERTALAFDDSDIAYLMSSSGTSGAPKAIQLTYSNLGGFVSWLRRDLLTGMQLGAVSGNVRYVFDVSLFELWFAWLSLSPISAVDHRDYFNSRRTIDQYRRHGVSLWISTPSAMHFYLRDPQFCGDELPKLKNFLFCGEVLSKEIARCLFERFPGCVITNTYGPTECTVAVTSVVITPEHLYDSLALPIGTVRSGCTLDLDGNEIIIRGEAVGPGYVDLPERQAAAFPEPGVYRTGDFGELKNGLWYFHCRKDRQIKLKGVRLDLDEIEQQIDQYPGVEAAIVAPVIIRGQPQCLSAYLVGPGSKHALGDIAKSMANTVPNYIVPRFWYTCDEIILNSNTKLDRSKMMSIAELSGDRYVHK